MHAYDEASTAPAGDCTPKDEDPKGGGDGRYEGAKLEDGDRGEKGMFCGVEGVELAKGNRAGGLCYCRKRERGEDGQGMDRVGFRDSRKKPLTTHGSSASARNCEERVGRAVAEPQA